MMAARANAQPRHVSAAQRHVPAWVVALGSGVAAAAVLTYLALPSARITVGGPGLANLSVGGIDTHITAAAVFVGGRRVPLTLRGTHLMPTERLRPGASGSLLIRVQGPNIVRFLPWDSETLRESATTPQLAQVTHRAIERPLGSGLALSFEQPVVAVRYQVPGGVGKTMRLSDPRRSVVLPLPAAQPGAKGHVYIWAQSRTWEQFGKRQTVRWSSTPYVTAATADTNIAPTSALTVTFSQSIKQPNLSNWKMAPTVPGQWKEISATQFAFTPSQPQGFGPGALVQVTIPSGSEGPMASTGSTIQSPAVIQWVTPPGSVLRLQQLLAVEGYLPVRWSASTPASATQAYEESTIYNPPQGQFQWAFPNLPKQLDALWVPGQMTAVTKGAIMQFEAENGLPVDGIAGPNVWSALINDRLDGKMNPNPYSYISVTEGLPETLQLWVGNKMTLSTKTNTGIPVTPTYLGTFPIYERLKFQIMKGKNPNGTKYADPVYWINYFKGSDAVHGFTRASYGFPQSLGCVEVPPSVAQTIYDAVNYGTLVTVNPVGVPPAPAH